MNNIMEFIKFKRSEINPIYCVDELREDWRIIFSVRDYTPVDEHEEYDCEAICVSHIGNVSDWDIQNSLLNAQKLYDKSTEVNSFIINGETAWLDKATRVGLMNSISILEGTEVANYTLWVNDKPYVMSITALKNLLKDLEIYAMECNNVTEQHIAEIKALTNRQDMLNYQIHTNYPAKVEITV